MLSQLSIGKEDKKVTLIDPYTTKTTKLLGNIKQYLDAVYLSIINNQKVRKTLTDRH